MSEALQEPNTKAPGVCFSSDAPPANGWGLRIGVFARKFCERVGGSQSAFWREWPSKPCTKFPNQQQLVLRRGFREFAKDSFLFAKKGHSRIKEFRSNIMYIYIYIYIFIFIFKYLFIYLFIYIFFIFIYLFIYLFIYVVYLFIYVCMYACMHACMYVCTYVCIISVYGIFTLKHLCIYTYYTLGQQLD